MILCDECAVKEVGRRIKVGQIMCGDPVQPGQKCAQCGAAATQDLGDPE